MAKDIDSVVRAALAKVCLEQGARPTAAGFDRMAKLMELALKDLVLSGSAAMCKCGVLVVPQCGPCYCKACAMRILESGKEPPVKL